MCVSFWADVAVIAAVKGAPASVTADVNVIGLLAHGKIESVGRGDQI